MICKNCGTDNQDYYVFCKNCSVLLMDDPAPSPGDTAQNTPDVAPRYDYRQSTAQADYSQAPQPPTDPTPFGQFSSSRPALSEYVQDARRQSEQTQAQQYLQQNQQPAYAQQEPPRMPSGSGQASYPEQQRQEIYRNREYPQDNQINYREQQYRLTQMPQGPYYDPRDRHHAVDPWDLLDAPDKQQSLFDEIPVRQYPTQPAQEYYGQSQFREDDGYPAAPRYRDEYDRQDYNGYSDHVQNPAVSRQRQYREPDGYMPRNDRGIPYNERYDNERYSSPVSEQVQQPQQPSPPRREYWAPAPPADAQPVTGAMQETARHNNNANYGAYEYEDEYYEKSEKKARKRHRLVSWVFWLVIAALVGLILYFVGNSLIERYGSLDDAFAAIFSSKPSGAERKPPEVLPDTHDGKPAHTVIIYGFDGETVNFPDVQRQVPIIGGVAKIIFVDVSLIPDEPDQMAEKITVKPNAYIIGNDEAKTQIEIDIPEFEVEVPSAKISLDKPTATSNLTLESPDLEISGSVPAGSFTRVFIDDTEISNLVNDQGRFEYTYKLPDFGEYKIVVKAQLVRHRAVEIPITVIYPKTEVAIEIDPGVQLRTNADLIEIKGTFEPGATLTINPDSGAIDGDPDINTSAGSFLFRAKLETYGRNKYILKAASGNLTSTKEVSIIRAPNIDDYTKQAVNLDYNAVKSNYTKYTSKVFAFDGTVTEILESADDSTTLLFDLGSNRIAKVEYFNTIEVKVGDVFKAYGSVTGVDSERKIPMFNVHFFIKK